MKTTVRVTVSYSESETSAGITKTIRLLPSGDYEWSVVKGRRGVTRQVRELATAQTEAMNEALRMGWPK